MKLHKRRPPRLPSPAEGEGVIPRAGRESWGSASIRNVPRSQVGSVTIWGIGLTLVIAAFAGIVLDTWRVFAERQDLAGMADAAAIAAVTAIDIDHLNATGEVILDEPLAVDRALAFLQSQDGWSAEIVPSFAPAPDAITVTLDKDVDLTLVAALLPGEEPLHVTVTAIASPNVIAP